MEEITVYLNKQEAELFVSFRKYQPQWERLLSDDDINSVHIHKDPETKKLAVFEWFEKERL